MKAIELLIGLSFLFLWITCVYESLCSLTGGRIRKIESKSQKLAERLENWLEKEDSYRAELKLLLFLSAATLAGVIYHLLLEVADAAFAERWGWLIVLGTLAVLTIIAEMIARVILYRYDILLLKFSMPLVSALSETVFLPMTTLLGLVSQTTDDWNKQDATTDKVSVEDEIMSFVENYTDDAENDLEEGEKQMIRGILDLGDMLVREIMTPRVDLDAMSVNSSAEEAKRLFIETGRSRIPVYGRSIDEIHGIIYAKDFIDASKIAGKTLNQLSHKPLFIPETKKVAELLDEFRRSHVHFAVIIDEYGGTSGIITLEDIIEEIVGEVHDEYDTEEDIKQLPQLMSDGTILLEARTLIADINEIADIHIPDDDSADTIGGFICSELGRIPESGEIYTIPDQASFRIVKADTRKIIQLQLTILDDSAYESD